jgi:hypothetical protein
LADPKRINDLRDANALVLALLREDDVGAALLRRQLLIDPEAGFDSIAALAVFIVTELAPALSEDPQEILKRLAARLGS